MKVTIILIALLALTGCEREVFSNPVKRCYESHASVFVGADAQMRMQMQNSKDLTGKVFDQQMYGKQMRTMQYQQARMACRNESPEMKAAFEAVMAKGEAEIKAEGEKADPDYGAIQMKYDTPEVRAELLKNVMKPPQ